MSVRDFNISFLATAIAEIVTLPICTVKTNYQTNLAYKSVSDVCRDTFRKRGLWGFYNSSAVALASQTVSTSTKFTSYMYLRSVRNIGPRDIFNNMINGMIAGFVSSICVHPIDVIKIHKQTAVKFIPELKKIGPSLFYRGYSKSLGKNIILTSIIFPTYDFYKYYIHHTLLASGLSSITTTLILQPIDYLKIRHISGQKLYLKNGSMTDNLKYYYRGFHINLARVIPHFMITMYLIELFKERLFDK